MKYIIMCGGEYKAFKKPKQLTEVNGETLIGRTIRLLKENGITDIYISSNDPRFDEYAPRLENKNNNFVVDNGKVEGYWLDAFYPINEEVCYIFGDVYFSPEAIKTIVEYESNENTLFGNSIAKNEEHKNWGEPFAYKVKKYNKFMQGVKEVKKLYDEGKIKRHPIVWELYRYLHNLDINTQVITDDYVAIDDYTIDIDAPEVEINI
jgi:choline kinase